MSFEELQKDDEILSREDEKTRQLLGSLKRVDAPKDFDFRLKARIANSKSSDFAAAPPRLFPILRYVAPLSLAIVILAVLVFNGLYSFDNQSAEPPVLVEKIPQRQDKEENLPISGQSQKQIVVGEENNSQKANAESSGKRENSTVTKETQLAVSSEKPNSKKRSVEEDDRIFSRKSASSVPPVFYEKGVVNSNKVIEKSEDFNNRNEISIKEVLNQIGVEAAYSDKKWKVVSVKKDSPAARSGVEPNDVVEAIDENQTTTETISKKAVNGKNLRVTRDGKKVEIKLQD